MQCDRCGGSRFSPNDKEKHRWKCLDCGKKHNPNPDKRGPKTIGDRPMTPTERKQRSRLLKKLNQENQD